MSILNEKEKEEIISRSKYWREVAERENSGEILTEELIQIVRILRTKILWILETYVKKERK